MNRVAKAVFVGSCVASFVLLFGGAASAHANLARSDPAAGALLAAPPSVVTMTFTQPIDPALSIVHVLDRAGTAIETGPATVGANAKVLQVPLPSGLGDGVFTVNWRVVSSTDGHVTAGAFAFGVGVAPGSIHPAPAGTPATPPPSPASVIGKVGLYAGLAILFAAAIVGLVAWKGVVPAHRPVAIVGACAASLGAVTMLLAERSTIGVSLGSLLGSRTGHDYVWLLVAVALAAGTSLVAAGSRSKTWLVIAGVAVSFAMLVRAIGGHAAETPDSVLEVTLQWVHFMAVSAWMGGVTLVLVSLRGTPDPFPLDEVRRYSRLAGYALAITLVTGVLRATSELGGISALLHPFESSYHTTLTIKVLFVLGLIALGALNRYRSLPRLPERPQMLRSVVTAETVGAVVVLSLTGILTGLPPQPATTAVAPVPHIVVTGSDFATTMNGRLVVSPGAAGPNRFDVTVSDFDDGTPVDASDVSLRFEPVGLGSIGPSTLELRRNGERWTADGTQLSLDGIWNVTIVVQTTTSGTEIPLALATRLPDQRTTVSTAEGQPDLYTMALSAGQQIQAYNDPGSVGPGELHLTAFDATGNELPLRSVVMTALSPSGESMVLNPRRFSPGHFVAGTTLSPGTWTFFFQMVPRDGSKLVASFVQSIS